MSPRLPLPSRPKGSRPHCLILYTRPGCHLCEDAKKVLERLADQYSIVLQEVDITQGPLLYERYKDIIPVVEEGGRDIAVSSISEDALKRALLAS